MRKTTEVWHWAPRATLAHNRTRVSPAVSAPTLISDGLGATVGAWTEVVRRARLGRPERKAAALILASYADHDGTSIHCGAARLALDLEASYRTALRCLAWLREVGLIERVRQGNARRGLSDEYRLIFGPQLLDHLDLPDPDQYRAMRRAMLDRTNSIGSRDRAMSRKPASLRDT